MRAAGPCDDEAADFGEAGAEVRGFLAACVIGQFGYIELVGARVCVCAPVCTHVCARERPIVVTNPANLFDKTSNNRS